MRAIPVALLFTASPALAQLDLLSNFAAVVNRLSTPFPFFSGFNIEPVADLAESLPSHSWEYGAAAQALLELYDPAISVFGEKPFPIPVVRPDSVRALKYAQEKIVIGSGGNGLSDGAGSVGDPASLGVSAILLGKTDNEFAVAAKDQMAYILYDAPRFRNGAISQRVDVPELWADFMYMVPPFMAYYAVDTDNSTLLQDTVTLCANYRQVLKANLPATISYAGLWKHIVGPQSADHGLWATGNGWAAGGMARVLATVIKAPSNLTAGWGDQSVVRLTTWIKEIIDGAMGAPMDDGLLRNYLDNTSGDGHGFGEISGSAILASVVYRMTVLQPDTFGDNKYLSWADGIRNTISRNDKQGNPRVTIEGIVMPAVNPLGWLDKNPFTTGSPEGQAFVVLMYSAWRDCVHQARCKLDVNLSKKHGMLKSRRH
ncbi:hypothetical protein Moror_10933 [Moniliophthora roreri MCA 2997]|uniref:Uncharacterized protein n=1 Tax=Moniliophthora roreri (strain MCA 2997) TaxID=1381753 RepID=V2X1P1_MONRO|nr:hypothetical protein Moror_10933 [Moniliophthora roreri MCA 2997]